MATQPEEFLTFTDIYAQNYLLAPNDILYVEADYSCSSPSDFDGNIAS